MTAKFIIMVLVLAYIMVIIAISIYLIKPVGGINLVHT